MDKNILIIDHNWETCGRIKQGLIGLNANVFCALTMYEALQYLTCYNFCLIILDVEISAKDDHTLLRTIGQLSSTPILILSSHTWQYELLKVLKAGAHAYIENPYTLEECIAQAQSLIQLYYKLISSPTPYYTLVFGNDLVIDPKTRQVLLAGKNLRLTRKEFDLLYYLASNPGQVFSREQLYNQVWDDHTIHNVDEAVKAQIKTLRKKLSVAGNEYIKNVWGIGYRFHSEPNDE